MATRTTFDRFFQEPSAAKSRSKRLISSRCQHRHFRRFGGTDNGELTGSQSVQLPADVNITAAGNLQQLWLISMPKSMRPTARRVTNLRRIKGQVPILADERGCRSLTIVTWSVLVPTRVQMIRRPGHRIMRSSPLGNDDVYGACWRVRVRSPNSSFPRIIAHVDERFSEVAVTVHAVLELYATKHSTGVILRYDVVAPCIAVLRLSERSKALPQ